MATIITRTKGGTAKNSPLTNEEVDDNFINLNTDKQEKLVSGTNIKTVGSESLLGSGDIPLNIAAISGLATALSDKQATLVSGTNIKTINGVSIVGSGNMTVATSEIPASQAEMEAGAEAGLRSMSPLRVKQAINAIATGIPAGTIVWVARSTAPTGYLKANGATISRTVWADLFAAIGTTFGSGDGSTTFSLPDLRGEFIRGWDDARGVDIGRVFGSAQADELKSHSHTYTSLPGPASSAYAYGTGQAASAANTGSTGGTETRPRNIALLACIKY